MLLASNQEPPLLPPSQDFGATRRVLLIVLIVSVIVPVACFVGYCYRDYVFRKADANDVIMRLARVAQEHALKVMDLNNDMTARVMELLGHNDAAQIRKAQQDLHRRLAFIGGGYPQVAAIAVFGAGGELLASSRYFPVPEVSIAHREDFGAAQASWPASYISLPMHASVSGRPVFDTTTSRFDLNGRFLGVVTVALRRDYFGRFYNDLAGQDLPLSVGLYRRDGTPLVAVSCERRSPTSEANGKCTGPELGHSVSGETLSGLVELRGSDGSLSRSTEVDGPICK